MIDRKKVDRLIGFDFVSWYEQLLLIKAIVDLPKPKNGVYHQGPVNEPGVQSIFETTSAGFVPTGFGNANVWNRLMREKKLGK